MRQSKSTHRSLRIFCPKSPKHARLINFASKAPKTSQAARRPKLFFRPRTQQKPSSPKLKKQVKAKPKRQITLFCKKKKSRRKKSQKENAERPKRDRRRKRDAKDLRKQKIPLAEKSSNIRKPKVPLRKKLEIKTNHNFEKRKEIVKKTDEESSVINVNDKKNLSTTKKSTEIIGSNYKTEDIPIRPNSILRSNRSPSKEQNVGAELPSMIQRLTNQFPDMVSGFKVNMLKANFFLKQNQLEDAYASVQSALGIYN